MDINKRIEKIRISENLSRKDFGLKINKSVDAVYNMERRSSSINVDVLDSICKAFYINKTWLLDGEGEMYCIPKENIDIGNTLSKVMNSEKLSILTSQLVKLDDEKLRVISDLVSLLSQNEK